MFAPPGELEDVLSDSADDFRFKNVILGRYVILFSSDIDPNWAIGPSFTIEKKNMIRELPSIILTHPIVFEIVNKNRQKNVDPCERLAQ
jgi:hypothetical protein